MITSTWKDRAPHFELADAPRPRLLTAGTVFLFTGFVHRGRQERFGWWQWLQTAPEATDYFQHVLLAYAAGTMLGEPVVTSAKPSQ